MRWPSAKIAGGTYFTVSFTGMLCTSEPQAPVIVMVNVPFVDVSIISVDVPDVEIELAVNDAAVPSR